MLKSKVQLRIGGRPFLTILSYLTFSTSIPTTIGAYDDFNQTLFDEICGTQNVSPFAVIEDGVTCVCTNCAIDPPGCLRVNCHGGRVPFPQTAMPPFCVSCTPGRKGKCCEETECLHNTRRDEDGKCDCDGTGYVGEMCEILILNCQNEGKKHEIENVCECTNNYEGRECEFPRCYQGKLNDTRNGCNCHEGHTGKFCETKNCLHGNAIFDAELGESRCACSTILNVQFFEGEFCNELTRNGFTAFVYVPAFLVVWFIAVSSWVIWRRRKNAKKGYGSMKTDKENNSDAARV